MNGWPSSVPSGRPPLNIFTAKGSYVLITAARNEEGYIPGTMASVLGQTVQPIRWVIVSDGSEDRTEEIVQQCAAEHKFIQLVRREKKRSSYDFSSKVFALQEGRKRVTDLRYDFIGHLDADVSFNPEYYELIMEEMLRNPQLGVAGGFVYENQKGTYRPRPFNHSGSVAGCVQLFRRQCDQMIGQWIPMPMGGEDTYAEVMARKQGWEVRSFPEMRVCHHKSGTGHRGGWRKEFRLGLTDYALGTDPLFEMIKCLRRINGKPYLMAALLRIQGFLWAYMRQEERPVSDEFVRFFRSEQRIRLKSRFLKRNRADSW